MAKKASAKKASASAKPPSTELPIEPFADAKAWQRWLARNHGKSRGLWIRLAKKGSGIASITYPEAVEHALCWGWIDGQVRSVDATWYVQRFTPRGPTSIWSKINRAKALALIESGAMQPAGLAEVERAQRDGRWARAYDSPSKASVPEDLGLALAGAPKAAEAFATLDATNRYAILHRVQTAKKPETRAKRIAEFVTMLAEGRTLHPRRTKAS